MYNIEKVREIFDHITEMRNTIYSTMSDSQRRLVVVRLREIATELDCLKPVDAIEGELTRVELKPREAPYIAQEVPVDPIPAAPGPDYATRKELDALRVTLVNMINASQDEFLSLAERVGAMEKWALSPDGKDHKSGTHIAATVEQAVQGRRTELYNQAYLAALPAVVHDVSNFEEAAVITARIANQSMEYLK